ncbi:MAG: exodeoxyribonuclease VII small subunit [Chlorobiaceae bacterium]|nr:exodeoxyribonuclease VII small subunit [Chlorobiaceae bacterium]
MKKQKDISGSFESMMHRLEEIVESLEGGTVPLEQSLILYEEGVSLSKQCIDKLRASEIKLKQLSKDIEGNFELFDTKQE